MKLAGEVVILVAKVFDGVTVGGALGERLDAFAEGFEGPGDVALGCGVWVEVEGCRALAFEERKFDVVAEEQQLVVV